MGQFGESGITQEQLDARMNPYLKNVIDIQEREAINDAQRQLQDVQSQAGLRGAFGGSRQGILESEVRDDLNQRLDDIRFRGLSQGYESAYDRAFQGADLARSTALSGADLGRSLFGLESQRANLLDTFGTKQRQLKDAKRNLPRQRELDRMASLESLQSLLNQGAGVTGGRQVTGRPATPNSSTVGAAVGSMVGGAANDFFDGVFNSPVGGINPNADPSLPWSGSQAGSLGSTVGGWLGFKEGGEVKKNQEGGILAGAQTILDFLSRLNPTQIGDIFSQGIAPSSPPTPTPKPRRSQERAPTDFDLDAILELAGVNVGESTPGITPFPTELAQESVSPSEQAKELFKPEEPQKQESSKPTMGLFQTPQPDQDPQYKPVEKREKDSYIETLMDDPMFRIGAQMLANAEQDPFIAFGKAMSGEIQGRQEGKMTPQEEMDLEIAQKRAEQYERQNDLQALRMARELEGSGQRVSQTEAAKMAADLVQSQIENSLPGQTPTEAESRAMYNRYLNMFLNVSEGSVGTAASTVVPEEDVFPYDLETGELPDMK